MPITQDRMIALIHCAHEFQHGWAALRAEAIRQFNGAQSGFIDPMAALAAIRNLALTSTPADDALMILAGEDTHFRHNSLRNMQTAARATAKRMARGMAPRLAREPAPRPPQYAAPSAPPTPPAPAIVPAEPIPTAAEGFAQWAKDNPELLLTPEQRGAEALAIARAAMDRGIKSSGAAAPKPGLAINLDELLTDGTLESSVED